MGDEATIAFTSPSGPFRFSRVSVGRKAEAVLLGIFVFTGGLSGVLTAQSIPEESDRFEVASIRLSSVEDRPSMEFMAGGGVRATNVTLKMLIQMAYDIRSEQVSGGPGWTELEEYTVIAKGPPVGSPVRDEAAQMELTRKRLQALLTERFHLALKLKTNQGAGYVLAVDKKGHKMTLATDPGSRQLRQVGRWEIRAEGVGMSTFARFLSVHLHGTVEDRTGLEGGYTFHLKWDPELREGQSVRSFEGLPEDSLIPAVREQLGLRLEQQKVATDRYSIERAEKPTEN